MPANRFLTLHWWTDLLSSRRGQDIRHSVVYAQRLGNDRKTMLFSGKARRREQLQKRLVSLTKEDRGNFFRKLHILKTMLRMHLLHSDNLLLWFDNSAIQSILHQEKPSRAVSFSVLLAFLILVEDYCLLDVACHVSAVTVFEANHLQAINSERETNLVLRPIADAIASIGLECLAVGFDGSKELGAQMRRIKGDAEMLRRAVDDVRRRNWKLDKPTHGRVGIPLPLAFAEEEVPSVVMRYFAPWHAKLILMHRIVERLYEDNAHWPEFRRLCDQELRQKAVGQMISTAKNRLNGLGDIELYSLCELNTQSASKSVATNLTVSFDETLNHALWNRLQLRGNSLTYRGGQSDPEAFSKAFIYELRRQEKLDRKLAGKSEQFDQVLKEFNEHELRPWFAETGDARA